ncbi:MAG: hypothetical protein ACKVHL_12290 [Rhodospirillales bacterium]|jgi:flagellar biosynthesis/type III secretory pathway M-ring protein FliF/YscJ
MEPNTKSFEYKFDEAIDIGPSRALDISRLREKIDAKLNTQVGRLIKRDPDRSISVIRRWLAED